MQQMPCDDDVSAYDTQRTELMLRVTVARLRPTTSLELLTTRTRLRSPTRSVMMMSASSSPHARCVLI